MRDAMLQVAAGDLAVDTGYAAREDEIGALAGALGDLQAAGRREGPDRSPGARTQRRRHGAAAGRSKSHVGEFEGLVRQTLNQLGDASGQMRTTSSGPVDDLAPDQRARPGRREGFRRGLDERRERSPRRPKSSAPRSTTSASRRRTPPASPAARSNQARDDRRHRAGARPIGGADRRSGRPDQQHRGADQPAGAQRHHRGRARRRGRPRLCGGGLEVKSLASQTAKATEEISEQIADIQKVAGEAIDAIKSIGGIIGEVNEVATAIAAAVQEQGAATQEITRSTQFAAQGTKNVSDNITGVKADADAAATAADDVKQASETLETQSQQLGNQVTAVPRQDPRGLSVGPRSSCSVP